MKFHTIRRTLLAALVAGTVATGAAQAATSYQVTVPGGVVFEFQKTPTWVTVPEAQGVYVVRDDMRPSSDYFRYQNNYYVYSGGQWYRASSWNGRYVLVSESGRSVLPRETRALARLSPGWKMKQPNKSAKRRPGRGRLLVRKILQRLVAQAAGRSVKS